MSQNSHCFQIPLPQKVAGTEDEKLDTEREESCMRLVKTPFLEVNTVKERKC
jgi:hypothetical protein